MPPDGEHGTGTSGSPTSNSSTVAGAPSVRSISRASWLPSVAARNVPAQRLEARGRR